MRRVSSVFPANSVVGSAAVLLHQNCPKPLGNTTSTSSSSFIRLCSTTTRDDERIMSRIRDTTPASSLFNSTFRRGGESAVENISSIPPLYSKRGVAYTSGNPGDRETLFYVHRTDLHGNTTRLSEVFFSRKEADNFAHTMESKGTKNHYFSEQVDVDREIVRKANVRTEEQAAAEPKPIIGEVYDPNRSKVSRGPPHTLTKLSLQDLGAPLPRIKGDEAGEEQEKAYTRYLYEVWRMDTNGNSMRTEPVYEEKEQAEAVVDELYSHGHKQHYYIEIVKVVDEKKKAELVQQNEDDDWE